MLLIGCTFVLRSLLTAMLENDCRNDGKAFVIQAPANGLVTITC